MNQVGIAHTAIGTRKGYTFVQYHSTEVIRWNANRIVLNHGGHKTYTTKSRINQASHQYGLGINVFQKDNEWFVYYGGVTKPWNNKTFVIVR